MTTAKELWAAYEAAESASTAALGAATMVLTDNACAQLDGYSKGKVVLRIDAAEIDPETARRLGKWILELFPEAS